MGSRERLRVKYGEAWGWPPATMTEEQDRERHEREVVAHETFNYAARSADESRLLGWFSRASPSVHTSGRVSHSPQGATSRDPGPVMDARVRYR
jgi:hypothetical protein